MSEKKFMAHNNLHTKHASSQLQLDTDSLRSLTYESIYTTIQNVHKNTQPVENTSPSSPPKKIETWKSNCNSLCRRDK